MEDIVCILVRQPDGTDLWLPRDEYLRNPPLDTFVIREPRPKYEMIVKMNEA